jgi:tetratricopeptide (TPR) repeat protein
VPNQPNERLRAAIAESGLSNKALARAVRTASAAQGRPVRSDHTAVIRWLAGGQPRGATADALCRALTARLGRPVTPPDIGLAQSKTVDPALGLIYPDTAESAVCILSELWNADLEDNSQLKSVATHAGAWSDASLAWLVRPGRDDFGVRFAGLAVGPSDVEALLATTATFAALDNRFGGGHARRSLVEFLRTDLAPLLAGTYSDAIGSELFAAAAEATLLAAWMSYDAGSHGLAQRYFVQALRLAQGADDGLLAATILDAMSHQATFLGRFREAANLARAAGTGTAGQATRTLHAHFKAMEARALAGAGDATATERALAESVRLFERRDGEDPSWISYVDDAELSAELAHCYRDLGRADETVRYARAGLAHEGSSPRSDYFVTMVLADGHLAAGELEQACEIASGALVSGSRLKSARAAEYLRQFCARLQPYKATSAVIQLDQRIAEARASSSVAD